MRTLWLVHGLLRLALEQLGRQDDLTEPMIATLRTDLRRAFVTLSQLLERHEAKTD